MILTHLQGQNVRPTDMVLIKQQNLTQLSVLSVLIQTTQEELLPSAAADASWWALHGDGGQRSDQYWSSGIMMGPGQPDTVTIEYVFWNIYLFIS